MCVPKTDPKDGLGPTSTPSSAGGAKSDAPANATATCCPDAAWASVGGSKLRYFGFDDRTDLAHASSMLPPATNANAYWIKSLPVAGPAPSNRLTRDGAPWVSVEQGKTAEVTMNLKGGSGACLANVRYEIKPTNIASIERTSNATRGAVVIKGQRRGEATLIARCNGKEIGWFHIACYRNKRYRVGMCEINQAVSGTPPSLLLPRPSMNLAPYKTFFDECYRAACVEVVLSALPRYDLPATTNLAPGGGFFDSDGQMTEAQLSANWDGITKTTDTIYNAVRRRNPGYDKYLFLMMPPGPRVPNHKYVNGFARDIGAKYAIFFNSDSGVYSTAAHEFGHTINLRHPNDPKATSQYPKHLRASGDNIPVNDNFNLMGYGKPRPDRKELRYMQWKSVEGR